MKVIQNIVMIDGYIVRLRNNSFRTIYNEVLHDGGEVELNELKVKLNYDKWDIGVYEYSSDGSHECDLSLDIIAIYNQDMVLLWEECDLKEGDLVLCKNKHIDSFEEIGFFIKFKVVDGEKQYKVSQQINSSGEPLHSISKEFKICRKVVD